MTLSREINPILIGIIILSFVFFTGCITSNSPVNTSNQPTPISTSIPTQLTIIKPTEISQTTISGVITISTSSPLPIFTEPDRPMKDANGTRILSKAQAWVYAEKYLELNGLRHIQSDEVVSYEDTPKQITYKNSTQELFWTFVINRKSEMGFERGGVISIDAYDGQVVGYSQFM